MEQKPQWSHAVGEQTQTPESQAAPCWVFDAFLLDRRDERLWRDQESAAAVPANLLRCSVTWWLMPASLSPKMPCWRPCGPRRR